MAALAFEVEHRVDHVFEELGAGDLAVLGDVADQDQAGLTALGRFHAGRGHGPHLGHAARGALDRGRVHGLHRVHDDEFRRAGGFEDRDSGGRIRGRGGKQPVAQHAEPFGPGPELGHGFLARDIDDLPAGLGGESGQLSSKVDLPMPGSPPTSTAPPGVMPPPSTRSRPSMPVDQGAKSSTGWVARGMGSDVPEDATPEVTRPGATARSAMVFQAPHRGHWPRQVSEVPPHSVQTKTRLDLPAIPAYCLGGSLASTTLTPNSLTASGGSKTRP